MISFVLKGQIPSGKNAMQVTRTGRHYPLKRFVDWRTDAEMQIRKAIGKWETIEIPCTAHFNYFNGDLRRRDVPGMLDAVFHLLERIGIVKDDCLIKSVRWGNIGLDKENARIEVQIYTHKELGVLT